MKLLEKISQAQGPFYTFEFFPPRTEQGFSNLLSRISRLADLNPLAINITWGAGGSTKEQTLELASLTQKEHGIDTVMHLTCTNMMQGSVDSALRVAKETGIQNILALRGGYPPRGEEYWIPIDPRFTHARDLVSYIRSSPEFSDAFSLGVAAYPDGHADSDLDEDEEIDNLKAKVDSGADFIVTQLFYDVDNFLRWLQRIRSHGITIPVIPGIMPIQTYSTFLRLTRLCGTHVPDSIHADLELIKYDDQRVKDYGISLAVKMIRRLVDEGGLSGFHFCTLNLEKSVQSILETLGWTPSHAKIHNKLIAESFGVTEQHMATNPDLIVTPASATSSATNGLVSHVTKGDTGIGEANNASTWDEFPNGRFGDINSPAFGSQDLWGGFGRITPGGSRPSTLDDITALTLRFLTGEITSYPFSPAPLSVESQLILPHLLRLAKHGWWPVGSQPAVDGLPSGDGAVGWGPAGGYIYQKPFVEFFASSTIVERLERAIGEVKGIVDFLAGNNAGELKTSVQGSERNAVTWGVFPGKEIIQSTIIEQESFLTWKDEAFSIWTDWASQFPPSSQERQLLENIRDTRWLVNVTHHDFKDPDGLWRFLFEDIGLDDASLT